MVNLRPVCRQALKPFISLENNVYFLKYLGVAEVEKVGPELRMIFRMLRINCDDKKHRKISAPDESMSYYYNVSLLILVILPMSRWSRWSRWSRVGI